MEEGEGAVYSVQYRWRETNQVDCADEQRQDAPEMYIGGQI